MIKQEKTAAFGETYPYWHSDGSSSSESESVDCPPRAKRVEKRAKQLQCAQPMVRAVYCDYGQETPPPPQRDSRKRANPSHFASPPPPPPPPPLSPTPPRRVRQARDPKRFVQDMVHNSLAQYDPQSHRGIVISFKEGANKQEFKVSLNKR